MTIIMEQFIFAVHISHLFAVLCAIEQNLGDSEKNCPLYQTKVDTLFHNWKQFISELSTRAIH